MSSPIHPKPSSPNAGDATYAMVCGQLEKALAGVQNIGSNPSVADIKKLAEALQNAAALAGSDSRLLSIRQQIDPLVQTIMSSQVTKDGNPVYSTSKLQYHDSFATFPYHGEYSVDVSNVFVGSDSTPCASLKDILNSADGEYVSGCEIDDNGNHIFWADTCMSGDQLGNLKVSLSSDALAQLTALSQIFN